MSEISILLDGSDKRHFAKSERLLKIGEKCQTEISTVSFKAPKDATHYSVTNGVPTFYKSKNNRWFVWRDDWYLTLNVVES